MDLERGARLINTYRIFPRLMVLVYLSFFIYAWLFVVVWFMNYDWKALPTDPIVGSAAVAAVAGFPAIILGILTKVLRELILSYWNGSSVAYSPKELNK